MKSIHIFLALLVAVVGLSTSLAGLRQTTVRYEKHTGTNFTRITMYNPALCLNVDTNCTYFVEFSASVHNPPPVLPYHWYIAPPPFVISIRPDGVKKMYWGN